MKDMILFPEDIDRLNLVLSQLVAKSDLLLAVLINKDGRLLTNQGSLDKVDVVSMAALVAGNTASTLAIAQLLGETEFSTMYHQGKNKHIYLASIDENTFLALVFDDRTNIDRVKVFIRQFDRQLKAGLVQVYDKTEDQVNLDLDLMGSYDSQSQQQSSFFNMPAQQGQYNFQQQKSPEYFDARKDVQKQSYNQQQFVTNDRTNQNLNQHQERNPISNNEEPLFDIDTNKSFQTPSDTNYIYLQNKIKESIKRKKEEQ
jgi:predicted regulator of Ras-like GTPase activity (Roadblock/LC7/MglB family)